LSCIYEAFVAGDQLTLLTEKIKPSAYAITLTDKLSRVLLPSAPHLNLVGNGLFSNQFIKSAIINATNFTLHRHFYFFNIFGRDVFPVIRYFK
jgi:hypothetical protein